MRKQTKIVALAAVLALGASFTSMAATYDWRLEDDGWYCYNEDGEAYDEEWVESYGQKYWVDEDGKYVTSSWIEDDNGVYYVGSDGKKTTSDWKFTYAMDEEDDEEAEEAWFYFDSKGKLVTDKKVSWKDNTYYVDKDGKMITGWIEYDKAAEDAVQAADDQTPVAKLIYVNEDGTRAANEWYHGFAYTVSEEEAEDLDEDSYVYYWIDKNGKVSTGKKTDINGETYLFGTDGVMLSGWVVNTADNTYEKANNELSTYGAADVFYCGGKDQGWVKKDRWIKVVASEDVATSDDDTTKYWFYLAKNGKVFVPELASDAVAATKMTFKNGETAEFVPGSASDAEKKTIDDETYLFDEDGKMLSGLWTINNEMNYFGGADEGQLKAGSFMIKDSFDDEYEVTFAKKASKTEPAEYAKYAALNGNVGGILYKNGIVQKSEEKGVYAFVTVNGSEYLVNYKGKVQTDVKDEYELENGKTFKFSANAVIVDADNSVTDGAITTR